MNTRIPRYLLPALLAAAIPAGIVLAQAPSPQPPEPQQKRERAEHPRLSPDALKRLQEGRQEGRITEMKEALKLNDAQLKLWAPVEQQIRASFAARGQAREEMRQRMEQRREQGAAERPPLPDMLDRASKRMTERAQRMQAFSTAFKPFYEALSDEQKAVAGIVLRDMRGGMHGPGRRWAMEHMDRMHGGPGGPGGPDGPGAPGGERQPR
jgi:hypothetical protein